MALQKLSQIDDKIREIFSVRALPETKFFVSESLTSDVLLSYFRKERIEGEKLIRAEELTELLMQLRTPLCGLGNMMSVFLLTENYVAVFRSSLKLFMGQLGEMKYTSSSARTFAEKAFDRFIEIVWNTKISADIYYPLIKQASLSVYGNPLFGWKNPASEFIEKYPSVSQQAEIKRQPAIRISETAETEPRKFIHEEARFKIPAESSWQESSSTIGKISPVLSSSSPSEQFLALARSNSTRVQDKTLGIDFDWIDVYYTDGTRADNMALTYLIDLFRTTPEESAVLVSEMFEKESLSNFAETLFCKLMTFPDIKASKWCIRLMAAHATDAFVEQTVLPFLKDLREYGRVKEADYLEECLLYRSKRF